MLKNECSIKDTTDLRKLIIENPELPILMFCGEEAWNGEHAYTQATSSKGNIERLTLYGELWLTEDDYKDRLECDLCDDEEYREMTDEEWHKMIEEKVKNTEFIKAIVIWIG